MAGELFDKNTALFKEFFNQALPFSKFVATGSEPQQRRWSDYTQLLDTTAAQNKLIQGFTRKLNVLVLAGIWCGDCARQCPMMQRIAEKSALIDLRFIDNTAHPTLSDELRIHGASRVPVVVVLSEDFFEVARFGDRTLSAYRRKAEQELGPACDAGIVAPPADALALELSEWLDFIERAQLLLRLSSMLRQRYND